MKAGFLFTLHIHRVNTAGAVMSSNLSQEEIVHINAYTNLAVAWLGAHAERRHEDAEMIGELMQETLKLFRRAERKRCREEKKARKSTSTFRRESVFGGTGGTTGHA